MVERNLEFLESDLSAMFDEPVSGQVFSGHDTDHLEVQENNRFNLVFLFIMFIHVYLFAPLPVSLTFK